MGIQGIWNAPRTAWLATTLLFAVIGEIVLHEPRFAVVIRAAAELADRVGIQPDELEVPL